MVEELKPPQEHPFDRMNREICETLSVKRCPFCGGKPRLSQSGYWFVICMSCQAVGTLRSTTEAAALAWNARVPAAIMVDPENEKQRAAVSLVLTANAGRLLSMKITAILCALRDAAKGDGP